MWGAKMTQSSSYQYSSGDGNYIPRGFEFESINYTLSNVMDDCTLRIDNLDSVLTSIFVDNTIEETEASVYLGLIDDKRIGFDNEPNKIIDDYGLDAKEFSDWDAGRSSITAESTTAPDGTGTGVKLTEDDTAANSHYLWYQNKAILDDTTYTWSIFLKGGTKNRCSLQIQEANPYTDYFRLHIDMSAGTIAEVDNGDVTIESSSITSYPNDWYLVTITGQFGSAASNQHRVVIYMMETDENWTVSYDGDDTSYIYIWGAKMTQSSSYQYPSNILGTVLMFTGEVDSFELDESEVRMVIGSRFTRWGNQAYNKHSSSCRWKVFKGDECGYAGGQTWCDRSYTRCVVLGATATFGGFRFLPSIENKKIWWGPNPTQRQAEG